MPKRPLGFTLIEVMIVMVIIAILSAVAYPSYQSYVQRANRGDAKRVMLDLSLWEERYYTNNNTYITTTTAAATSGIVNFWTQSPTSGTPNFNVTVTAPSGGTVGITGGYLITATAASGYSDPSCATLTLDYQGNKLAFTSSGAASSNCW